MYERGVMAWMWGQLGEASIGSIWFSGAFAGIWIVLVKILTFQS